MRTRIYRFTVGLAFGAELGTGTAAGGICTARYARPNAECCVPGAIATPMQEDVLTTEAKQYFESLIPRGTMGQSEEVASVALFLASNDSSFVNGVELFVDGGMTAI